jgi:hypothetical protein
LGTSAAGVFLPGNYLKIGGSYTSKGNSGYALDVNGKGNFTDSVTANGIALLSDRRIKKGIASLDSTFTVDSLSPKTYYNIRTKKQDIGFIADELQQVYPYLVTGTVDGEVLQSVNYIGLIGVLTKEIQTLKAQVTSIQTNYATTSELSGYATTSALSDYATKSSIDDTKRLLDEKLTSVYSKLGLGLYTELPKYT